MADSPDFIPYTPDFIPLGGAQATPVHPTQQTMPAGSFQTQPSGPVLNANTLGNQPIQYPNQQAAVSGAMARTAMPNFPQQLQQSQQAAAGAMPAIGGAIGSVGGPLGIGAGTAFGAQAEQRMKGQPVTMTGPLVKGAMAAGTTYAAGKALGLAGKGISKLIEGTPLEEQWQAINDAIGATKTSVKIPKSAASIEEAVTMPARGLQAEGFDAATLSKMSPIEQQAAIAPKWNAAGQAVDKAAIDATAKNVTLNPSQSALKVATSIQNPALQNKAVNQLSDLMQEVGIRDASKTTPLEALQLRRALQSGARFGPNGDLSSLGGIRAKLYTAVSKDLSDAVPGFSDIDQHYSDLNSAMKAINNSASKAAVKQAPTMMTKLAKIAPSVRDYSLAGGGVSGSLYAIYKAFK